jgi:hypothetical protein
VRTLFVVIGMLFVFLKILATLVTFPRRLFIGPIADLAHLSLVLNRTGTISA